MVTSSKAPAIAVPQRISEALALDAALGGVVSLALADFGEWFADNKLVFFPEYTDHGPRHITEVLRSAAALITDAAWETLTPSDVAVLVVSTLLHDCAMHLSEAGFLQLIGTRTDALLASDKPWPELWDSYVAEASRFDGRKLMALFGDTTKPRRPSPNPIDWTTRDKLLIGDFLRRHHPRLAHEIAMRGVPGPSHSDRIKLHGLDERLRWLSGLVARSHGVGIRDAVEWLPADERQETCHTHVPFLMAVLRIADYIQIHRERAPHQVLQVRSLASPLSQAEWRAHHSVETIHALHLDPEALFVKAKPPTSADFVKLQRLLASIQEELDQSWAVIGEIYGRFAGLNHLGLTVRRLRSNMDDVEAFAKTVDYVPVAARFDTAGADLLKLLVAPLYGSSPEMGVRELVQNAVDAVRELRDLGGEEGSVTVTIRNEDGAQWLEVVDTGIGMTADVIVNYFLRAGASFRNSDTWRHQHTDDEGHSRVLRAGRFGVGALAAFLLGDEMHVRTRHVGSAQGVEFKASIDDEVIDLRRASCPVGTSIRIRLTTRLRDDSWDWYCLASPPVTRRRDQRELPQRATVPSEGVELSPEWHRIRAPGFSDVQWTCRAGGHVPFLTCNGLVVARAQRSEWLEDHGELPLILTEFDDLHPFGLDAVRLATPDLSVFDPDGNLPLDLRRTALSVERLPFHDELLVSVSRDVLAYALLYLPETLARATYRGATDHPLLRSPDLNGGRTLAPWRWMTPDGWALLDQWTFHAVKPSKVLVLQSLSEHATGALVIRQGRDHVIGMNSDGVKGANTWLRFCLGGTSHSLGALSHLPRRGVTALIASKWWARVSKSNEIAKDLRHGLAHREIGDGWVLLETEGRNSEIDWKALAAAAPAHELEGFAEVDVDVARLCLPRTMSALATEWRDLLGRPTIPFARAEREALLRATPELHEYVEAYRRMWPQ